MMASYLHILSYLNFHKKMYLVNSSEDMVKLFV